MNLAFQGYRTDYGLSVVMQGKRERGGGGSARRPSEEEGENGLGGRGVVRLSRHLM